MGGRCLHAWRTPSTSAGGGGHSRADHGCGAGSCHTCVARLTVCVCVCGHPDMARAPLRLPGVAAYMWLVCRRRKGGGLWRCVCLVQTLAERGARGNRGLWVC